MVKRKVGYYYLEFVQGEECLPTREPFIKVMRYCMRMVKNRRLFDLPNHKFCFLDECSESVRHENLFQIVFKSAKHSYRAPLLDKNTANERDNPKTLEEGELYKTHMVIKFQENDECGAVYIENAQNLLTMQQVVIYLNFILRKYNEEEDRGLQIEGCFKQSAMARSDFRQALDEMSRVSVATFIVDKSIVGSSALNYSNLTDEAQEDIQLTIINRSFSINIIKQFDKRSIFLFL